LFFLKGKRKKKEKKKKTVGGVHKIPNPRKKEMLLAFFRKRGRRGGGNHSRLKNKTTDPKEGRVGRYELSISGRKCPREREKYSFVSDAHTKSTL